MKANRLMQFEILRIIFCLTVVMFHISCFMPIPDNKALSMVCTNGYIGVEMFFLLSGFFVAMNYKDKLGIIGAKAFIVKRMRKIYPMTAFSVIVGFILLVIYGSLNIGEGAKPISFEYLLTSLLCIHNGWTVDFGFNAYGSGTWFINVLVLLYILWALITIKSSQNNSSYVALCVIMVFIGFTFVHDDTRIPFLFTSSCRGYMAFFMGCLVFELYSNVKRETGKRIAILCFVISLIVLVGGMIENSLLGNVHVMFSILIFPSLMLIFLYNDFVINMFSKTFFSRVSQYTMSIYLTHGLVIYAVLIIDYVLGWGVRFEMWASFIIVILLILICSVAVHKIFKYLGSILYNKKFST